MLHREVAFSNSRPYALPLPAMTEKPGRAAGAGAGDAVGGAPPAPPIAYTVDATLSTPYRLPAHHASPRKVSDVGVMARLMAPTSGDAATPYTPAAVPPQK